MKMSPNESHHNNINKLKHLNATLENFVPKGRGNCIQRSVAMVMDVPTAKLVIGALFSGHSYIHAWVQDRGVFYDPSRFEEDGCLLPYEQHAYIAQERASDLRIVKRQWVKHFAERGSLSPWMLRNDNTYHTPPDIMGHVLLNELNIPYFVDDNGFLFPREP